MNKKETKIQKALGTYLSAKWKEQEKLRKEADKLWTEANKLYAEEKKLCVKRKKLYAKENELRTKAYKLYTNAVIEVYGPEADIDWNDGSIIND